MPFTLALLEMRSEKASQIISLDAKKLQSKIYFLRAKICSISK